MNRDALRPLLVALARVERARDPRERQELEQEARDELDRLLAAVRPRVREETAAEGRIRLFYLDGRELIADASEPATWGEGPPL